MAQKSISQGTLKTDFRVHNRPIFTPKLSKEVLNTGLRHYLTNCIKLSFFKYAAAEKVTPVLWSTLINFELSKNFLLKKSILICIFNSKLILDWQVVL